MTHSSKPNYILAGALALAFMVPNVTFGFAYIDLGLLHNGTAEVSPRVEVDTRVDADLNYVNTEGSLDVDGGVDAQAEGDADAGSEASVRFINVTRTEVDESAEPFLNMSAVQVDSDESLQVFASSTVSADPNLRNLTFTQDSVEVTYTDKGRVLALLPVTYEIKAVAHSDGRVEVDYPWYSFLMADRRAELEAELRTGVSEALRGEITTTATTTSESEMGVAASAEAGFTAQDAAAVAARMHSVLRASVQAGADAEASAENAQ